ncbi:MAG: right-handed parallel beta-helix repeat-containing protein, partial [Kiritimatiellae bacterium]|nr:right-handed parallel beta-helix repeat-containing protein [Kiritimatiellia bacterium]
REGMAPGRWFLDRREGRVYYQPLPGEEVEKLDFIRPVLRHVMVVNGGCDVRIDGIVFSGATPAYGDGSGFGGISAPAAVVVRKVDRLELRGVGIRNTAGVGLNIGGSSDVLVDGCSITSCGACAAFVSGANVVVRRTLVGDAGLVHRASCGVFASGSDIVIAGNEVKNVPYSGLIVFGDRNRVEDNFIHHVMQVLHDGAAVYGLFVDGAMRGNVVKDVVACGTGFGVHAYYADENSRNTVVEDNYAEGIPVPIHNHMSAGIVVRNNTLVNEGGDMVVSFERSVGCTFAGNRIFCGGKLDTVWLDGVSDWRGNVVSNGRDAPFEWNPPREPQPRRGPVEVARAPKAPAVDGKFEDGEWEGDFFHIDRRGDGHQTGFSSALVRFAWDDNSLYASFLAANFANGKMSFGSRWGVDDGIELDLGEGRKIRAFHDGSTEVLPEAFAGAVKVVALGKGKSGHHNPNLVRVEMSVPWKALGVEPKAGVKVPFAVRAYQSEFDQMKAYDSDAEPCELLLK